MTQSEFLDVIKQGDVDAAADLLESAPELLMKRDEIGATPLHYAAFYGHRDMVRWLIGKGADVNPVDSEFGATPAGWAIEYMRENGALMSIEIEDVVTAIERGDSYWVKRWLARFPALKQATNRDGIALSAIARQMGQEDILSFFES